MRKLTYFVLSCVSEFGYNLLDPAPDSFTDVKYLYMEVGLDKFPSYGFRPGSDVKNPNRLYLPEKLPAEFSLVATFKSLSPNPSYLFAVLNPFDTVVQLGLRISVRINDSLLL